LAVIDELQKKKNWEVLYFGRKTAAEGDKAFSAEKGIIEKKGIKFVSLNAGRWQRKFTRYTIPAILRTPLGFAQSFFYLIKYKPNIILSFGSYVSVPVVLCGWLLDIPIVTHEQTSVRGLANKINSVFANKIAVSWSDTIGSYNKIKSVFTGNPIRNEIFTVSESFWKSLSFDNKLPLILVTGGNQGSHALNTAIAEVLPKLLEIAVVVHQTGQTEINDDFERLIKIKEKLPKLLEGRYKVVKYLQSEEMGTLLNKSDLVISRAGANTVYELAALGKPAILVPLPWLYQDEQTKNASKLVEAGTSQILAQRELTGENLLFTVRNFLKNLPIYKKKANKAKELVTLDASKKIANLVEQTAYDH